MERYFYDKQIILKILNIMIKSTIFKSKKLTKYKLIIFYLKIKFIIT